MNQIRTPNERRFAQEVEARFGLMPNFFGTATVAPGLIDELWAFAKSAYLDSPMPSLFKERLFVYLSRFCAVRYCIVRHVGFLIGEGRPAGDASALPETIDQVIGLLTRPARCARVVEQALACLEAQTGPVDIPAPGTELESDLFDALTIIFLEPRLSERARNAVRRAFGEQTFETLVAFLAFIRTAHYWTETHPELAYEPDIVAVMQQHPDLAALLLDQTEAKRVAEGEVLRQVLAELMQTKQVLSQNETLQDFLLKLSDTLRPLDDALEIQRVTCRVLREHLVASRVMYAAASAHGDLHETAFDAEDNAHPAPIRYCIADFGAEAALQLRAGKPTWSADVLADQHLSEAEKSVATAIGVRAVANVPIVKRGNLVAMLVVHWKEAHACSARELEGLREVAERTWAATERVRAEAALRESEERLRLAQLQTGVGIWDRNLRTGRLTWTPELEAICGLEPGAVNCYADFRDRVHPDDIEVYEAKRDAAVQDRKTFNIELRMIRGDGQIRSMSITGGAVYNEATGEPVRILGNFVDITERNEAEEKLRKSEQAFRELLGALPAAIFVTDAGGRITYYNQAAVELWGRSPELGKDRWFDLARPCCADGKPAKLTDCPTEIALRKGKTVRGLEAILERADGTRIPVLPFPTPLRDATGTIVGVVNMTLDISERRQAEQTLAERDAQLALAGRAALVGSYVYDVNKGTMQVSAGYAPIHGLPEGTTETTIGEWRARVHPEDLARAEGLREQAFTDRRKEDNAEYRIALSNGEVRWIERRGTISYDGDGRPKRVVGVNIDVTERKRAEQHQRTLNAELDHRVKNVLATVTAIIAQTQEASGSPTHFVTALNSRINSLARTHELLSESNWRGASLAEIVRREFAPYSRGNTQAKGPSVTLKPGATQAIATVLHELTTNAAKYGALSNGSGRVSVRWGWLRNGSHDRLLIEWQETGGPPALAPSRSGYGTNIIRELIPFELGGAVELAFGPEGTRCRLEVPGEWTGKGRQRAEQKGVLDSA
jgi:PAS domain S-box-containing protein